MTYLVICPGFHAVALTDRAIAGLALPAAIQTIVIPTDQILPCDPVSIANHLERQIPDHQTQIRLNFLGFSAGTIGALGAAWLWRDRAQLGAIILCDGWGVPILPVWGGVANRQRSTIGRNQFNTLHTPQIYRVSHDRWTHDTWSRLGIMTPSFIADPAVEHLTLWRELDRVGGQAVDATGAAIVRLSAKDYIRQCLGCDETEAGR
jgi:hypothetical protein